MQNKEEVRQDRRRRLWNPTEGVFNTELNEKDEYSICEQFFRKINSLKDGTAYRPDISKDAMLSGFYEAEAFDFYEFMNREGCVETLRCTRLRKQAFELLGYAREEMMAIETLIERYHEEKDEDVRIALRELARVKTGNMRLIEEVRGRIIEIFSKAQDAGDYLEKMVKMIKKDKVNKEDD